MPKVLVADDSLTVLKVAERLLIEAGYEVALAANGEEALTWLAKERPDLVISDVIMPDKSGYDVCQFVRAQVDMKDVPVLLISGIIDAKVTRQAEVCQANGVLKKPFLGSSLQDRVKELLSRRNGEAPESRETGGGSKGYRVAEEHAQAFRRATARIKELETQLAEEQARAAQQAQRLAEFERVAATAYQQLYSSTSSLADLLSLSSQDGEGASGEAGPEAENKAS